MAKPLPVCWYSLVSGRDSQLYRVHTEWQRPLSGVHSIMMENQPRLVKVGGGGLHTQPLSLYMPSRTKLLCTLQLRGHSPYFISTPMCALWIARTAHLSGGQPHHPGKRDMGEGIDMICTVTEAWKVATLCQGLLSREPFCQLFALKDKPCSNPGGAGQNSSITIPAAVLFGGSGDPAWAGADPDPPATHGGPARLPAQVTQHESAVSGQQGGPLPPPRQPTTRQRRQQRGQRRQCSQVLVE